MFKRKEDLKPFEKKVYLATPKMHGEEIEFVSPDFCTLKVPADEWMIIDSETGLKMNWTCDGHPTAIYLKYKLPAGTLLRTLDPDYIEGKIRDTGR